MSDPREVLAEIKTRADNATSGPWFHRGNDLIGGMCVMPQDVAPSSGVAEVAGFLFTDDGEFIAAARADVPRLVAALTAVLGMHQRYDGPYTPHEVDDCTCGEPNYPCATVRAITAALEPTA